MSASSPKRPIAIFVGETSALFGLPGGGWRVMNYPSSTSGEVRAFIRVAAGGISAIVCIGRPAAHAALCELAYRKSIPFVLAWGPEDIEDVGRRPHLVSILKGQPVFHVTAVERVAQFLKGRGLHVAHCLPGKDVFSYLNEFCGATLKRARGARSVAITGWGIFPSDLVQETQKKFPEFEPHLARTDTWEARFASLWAILRADAWYSIGGPPSEPGIAAIARMLRKPRIVHWVGSDVSDKLPRLSRRAHRTMRAGIVHLCEVSWIREELREAGVTAAIAPLPALRMAQPLSMPHDFSVLLYLPQGREDKYGRRTYEKLFEEFRGEPIRYHVIAGGALTVPSGIDVTRLGWCDDLDPVYRDTSVLLRLTAHDGLSLMVLEALSYARYVIWTQPLPAVCVAQAYDEVCAHLGSLLDDFKDGVLPPNTRGAEFVRTTYDRRSCTEVIAHAWEAALDARRVLRAPS